ncbi:MAG: class I SAM-dependent methyltransferase, partial [Gammaproteobacteria bacterium]
MVELTRERIARFGERATVQQSDGGPRLRVESGAFDRIVCTYVLDILSDDDIAAFLEEAHRSLGRGGLMGLTSLTYGHTTSAQLVQDLWIALHRVNPAWVGGCRPLRLLDRLPEGSWRIVDHRVITSYFISCEVLVARRA